MDPKQTALIVIDMQHYFLEPHSSLLSMIEMLGPGTVTPFVGRVNETVVPAIEKLLRRLRILNLPIFFTEFGCNNADGSDLPFWAQKINRLCLDMLGKPSYPQFDDPSASTIPSLEPQEGEIVLKKTTAGALTSTNLHTHLHERGVRSVVVCGVNTDICVGQTARELADRGYEVVVVGDGCATLFPDAHRVTLETFGMVFGEVKLTDEVIGELENTT